MAYNPFGKGGAGAPLRDQYGEIITNTKMQAKINAVGLQRIYITHVMLFCFRLARLLTMWPCLLYLLKVHSKLMPIKNHHPLIFGTTSSCVHLYIFIDNHLAAQPRSAFWALQVLMRPAR